MRNKHNQSLHLMLRTGDFSLAPKYQNDYFFELQ